MRIQSQLVGTNQVPAVVDGLFGSGTLATYNPVVVDYADGELFLRTGGTGPHVG